MPSTSAPTNVAVSGPTTQVDLKIKGTPYTPVVDIIRVEIDTSLRLPAMATVWFNDDELHSKATSFSLDDEIEISFEVEEGKHKAFKGNIAAIEIFREAFEQLTVVRCHDALAKLYGARRSTSFLKMKYGDIVKKVAGQNGLPAGAIDPGGPVHDFVVQYDENDGEFLERLAAEYGFLLRLDESGRLCFGPIPPLRKSPALPSASTAASKQIVLGADLVNYEIAFGPKPPVGTVITNGWDVKNKALVKAEEKVPKGTPLVEFEKMASKLPAPAGDFPISAMPFPTEGHAQQVAKGVAREIAASFATLRGTITGNPFVIAGEEIAVGPSSASFSGWYRVTSARQDFQDGHLRTEIVCNGLGDRGPLGAAGGSHAQPSAVDPTNRVPWMTTGVVVNLKDPEKMGRIKVKLPALTGDKIETDWLRLIGLGNGDKRGTWWLPEVNDEVVVMFEHGDMRHGYVLGGVHNGKATPEFGGAPESGGKPKQRAITTTASHQILFTDEKGKEAIEVHTGDKVLVMTFDQKAGTFTIAADKQKATIVVDKKGEITIAAQGKVTIESKSDALTLKGNKVNIEAQTDVEVKGVNIKANATANFDAKANAKATLSGSAGTDVTSPAITTVKGSLVQIN